MKAVWSGNLGHLALRLSLAVALLLGWCLTCFGCGEPSFGADVETEMKQAMADGTLLAQATQEERLTWVDMPGMERFEGKYGLGICSFGGAWRL